MAGAYSTDLRGRVLAAMEAGETPTVAARRFAVGRSTAYRWMGAARHEGRRAAKQMAGGSRPVIVGAVEAALLGALEADNHLSLVECRERVATQTGVRVHPWTIGRALKRLGWTRKKAGAARRRAGARGRSTGARGVADGAGGGGRHRRGAPGVLG
jgi:transposase